MVFELSEGYRVVFSDGEDAIFVCEYNPGFLVVLEEVAWRIVLWVHCVRRVVPYRAMVSR